MRRRGATGRQRFALAAGLLAAVALGLAVAGNYGAAPPPAPPAALDRIAAANENAAAESAARLRADSEASAEAADRARSLREAEAATAPAQ